MRWWFSTLGLLPRHLDTRHLVWMDRRLIRVVEMLQYLLHQ